MSTASEAARAAARSKAERLTRSDPKDRVDASGYSPDGAMDAGVQTGPRPISRRQYRRGGQVEGEKSAARADRKPRASGGKAMTADSYLNRDVKAANEEREGTKHVGGMKKGGRAGKLAGGPLMQATGSPTLPPSTVGRKEGGRTHVAGCGCAKCGGGRVGHAKGGVALSYGGSRPIAGRLARKGGGRTKGKTNVNIIITQPGGTGGPPMPPPGAMPPSGGPVGLHQGAPPPAVMGPPAGGPPMMARKSGGRTNYPIDAGAGGGLGRLEKAKAYG
jgi:hypothetical protein